MNILKNIYRLHMAWESIIGIFFAVVSFLFLPYRYIWQSAMNRIKKLEEKVENQPSDGDVRQLLQDKLDPIAQDVKEVQASIQHLLDKLIDQKKNND